MSKWINKRKVSIINLPLPAKSVVALPAPGECEFEQLFYFAFKCFRLFALTPGQMVKQKDRYIVRNTRWMMLIVLLLVLVAWFALVETFFVENRTALITGIANHIQFIMNTIALTAAWVVPQLKPNELSTILEGFLIVDRELSCYNVHEPAGNKRVPFLLRFGVVLLALLLFTLYDGFVTFVKLSTIEVWYWLSHQVPFVIYALAFLHAYVLISWLHARFRSLNTLVERYYRQDNTPERQTIISFATMIKLDDETHENEDTHPVGLRRETSDDLQILAIVSRTIDLGQKIEAYFGPLFLTVYTALFSVTTIQSYYCYLHLTSKVDRGLTIESLILSGGIILFNVIAIVALPYICEQVESESKMLMSYLSKLSMKHGQVAQHSSIWFPNLISSVRFSAFGFFTINYNMLSGLVAGMVTYLIIFIQFNSMVPAEKDDIHQTRRQEMPDE
ncbi:gustatory receptor 23a-like [Anopheles marshallii]|uniref:gustatory receptor 23a-like n=1 Tax=Anopheles marshallii TaxID=1521116 RepID=UPI00237B9D55|nr:gustatory receptor 23a-like [Anopheles marshallii]